MGDPADGSLDFGTADFSIEAWIRTSANEERTVVGKRSSSRYWHVTVTDDPLHVGQLRADIRDGTVLRRAYSTTRVDDGAWHHIVVLFDRDAGTSFHVDGAASGFTLGSATGDVGNTAALQVRKVSGYGSFSGTVDEVVVYRKLLATSRIQAHYLAGASDLVPPAVTLTTPAGGASLTDTTPTFAGAAGTSVGDMPAVTVSVYAGPDPSGLPVQAMVTPAVGPAYSVDAAAQLLAGTYTALAEQRDAAGNVGVSQANTFTVVAGPTPPPPPTTDPVLVGAGDIADCGTSARDEETAQLLDGLPGATVFTLGDNVYSSGSATQFANCYEPTWGRHKARTRPSAGNHDYATPGGSGYFSHFGAAAGDPSEGWYSYDLGGWHVVVLNTNCYPVGGCDPGSPQELWLRNDLAAHPTQCTLAYWHHPLFTSRTDSQDPASETFWQVLYAYGADLIRSGRRRSRRRCTHMSTRDSRRRHPRERSILPSGSDR